MRLCERVKVKVKVMGCVGGQSAHFFSPSYLRIRCLLHLLEICLQEDDFFLEVEQLVLQVFLGGLKDADRVV